MMRIPAVRIVHGEFVPARPSPIINRLVWRFLRYGLRLRKVRRVEIASEDIARLRALRNERIIICPNHPTNTDPALIVELSRRARMPLYFLCCREAFDGMRGYWGWMIQRIGAYSVIRGTIDRESFRYTRELLARPRTNLVLFPEGEVYSQNDSLLPFQVGAIQLAMWGQEDARKTDPKARVLLVPVALRYRFEEDVLGVLDEKLTALEKKLQLPVSPPDGGENSQLEDLYVRMRVVAKQVLGEVEREYLLAPVAGGDLTPRFLAAKEAALSRAADLLGEKMPRGTIPERMRVLLHRAESHLHQSEDEGEDEDEDKGEEESCNEGIAESAGEKLVEHHHVLQAWRDLERLANWVAIYDGYASEKLSTERLAEIIFRLEKDVLGSATEAGMRIARVRVGEAIELPDEMSRREFPLWIKKLEDAVRELL